MVILANFYIDVIAVYQGIVFALFCIPVILLTEYVVYRLFLAQQSRKKAALTVFFANAVSVILGVVTFESIDDVITGLSFNLDKGNTGLFYNITLFLVMFFLTCAIEGFAVYPFRNKLRVQKVFLVVGLANMVSYSALGVMVVLFNFTKGSQ